MADCDYIDSLNRNEVVKEIFLLSTMFFVNQGKGESEMVRLFAAGIRATRLESDKIFSFLYTYRKSER